MPQIGSQDCKGGASVTHPPDARGEAVACCRGSQSNPSCDLPPGHAGYHEGMYRAKRIQWTWEARQPLDEALSIDPALAVRYARLELAAEVARTDQSRRRLVGRQGLRRLRAWRRSATGAGAEVRSHPTDKGTKRTEG